MGYIYTEIISLNDFGNAVQKQREAFNEAVINAHLAYDHKIDDLLVNHNQSLQGRSPITTAELDATTNRSTRQKNSLNRPWSR